MDNFERGDRASLVCLSIPTDVICIQTLWASAGEVVQILTVVPRINLCELDFLLIPQKPPQKPKTYLHPLCSAPTKSKKVLCERQPASPGALAGSQFENYGYIVFWPGAKILSWCEAALKNWLTGCPVLMDYEWIPICVCIEAVYSINRPHVVGGSRQKGAKRSRLILHMFALRNHAVSSNGDDGWRWFA